MPRVKNSKNLLRNLVWKLGKAYFNYFGTKSHLLTSSYIVHRDNPTGTAVALISGANRSLVAYIGAAQNVSIDNLKSKKITNIIKISDLIYMEGFFLPHRIDTVKYIHKYCYENERPFVFNLSASYICMNHSDDAMFLAQNCDILIGNYKEFQALLTAANLMEDIKSFAMRLSQGYKNVKKLPYGKIIIITNGSKSVICAHTGGIVEEIPVPKIDTNKIGDTNGAGDAFAAGFLAGLFAQQTPIGCLKWGCWVAHQIIQQVGCTIPSYTAEVLKGINE